MLIEKRQKWKKKFDFVQCKGTSKRRRIMDIWRRLYWDFGVYLFLYRGFCLLFNGSRIFQMIGVPTFILAILHENCIKMNKNGPRGDTRLALQPTASTIWRLRREYQCPRLLSTKIDNWPQESECKMLFCLDTKKANMLFHRKAFTIRKNRWRRNRLQTPQTKHRDQVTK